MRETIMAKRTLLEITPNPDDELDPGGTTEDLQNESNQESQGD